MPEQTRTLWAPWRMDYIRSINREGTNEGCFLCRYWSDSANDRAHHVIWRGEQCFATLNSFPYNNGHLLIAPGRHVPLLSDLDDAGLAEMIRLIRDTQTLLSAVLRPNGFNIGINVGRCAGAGLPDHVHAHVVPRWDGDTNFMSVIGDTRVIPQSLDDLYAELAAAAPRAGLPPLPDKP